MQDERSQSLGQGSLCGCASLPLPVRLTEATGLEQVTWE